MKTMTTMKGFAFAAMMMFAMTASANNNSKSDKKSYSFELNVKSTHSNNAVSAAVNRSTTVNYGRVTNHSTAASHNASASMRDKRNHGCDKSMKHQCKCRSCKKVRKALEKHWHKQHYGRHQNRMACRTCMKYSSMLHHHYMNKHMNTRGHRR